METPTPQPESAPPEARVDPADEGSRQTTPEMELGEAPAPAAEEVPPPGPDAERPPRPRITVLGDYRLGGKLGAGAMGAVYRAWQISRDRPAAVKVLRPHLAKNRVFLERFRREAHVMARLSHPNIVRCYGVGKQFNRHYLAMELVEGCSLGDWLYRLKRLSVGDAVHVALAIGRALQHAHQNGLVHRDVKPDNVLITPDGAIKLADLGLAKGIFEEPPATHAGHGAGTPVYMAPEQARSKEVDPRSDLYAVGCVLYHMLTGQFPFRGETSMDVIRAKLEGHYTPARQVDPAIPPELEAVLDLLLATDPDQRYQSATDLVGELEELGLGHRSPHFLRDHAPPAPPEPGRPAPPTEESTVAEEKRWYVLHQGAEGRWQTSRLSTTDVIRALDDRHFAETAQASPTKGTFRFLADIPEFRVVLEASKAEAPRPDGAQAAARPEDGRARRGRLSRALPLILFFLVVALCFWLGHVLVR